MASAYAYCTLKNNQIEISRLPEILKSISGMNGRLDSVEAALASWTSDRKDLRDHLASLDRKFDKSLQRAQQHADQVTATLEGRIVSRIEKRNAVLDARLAGVESEGANTRRELTRLQRELTRTRQEIASVRHDAGRELTSLRADIVASDYTTKAVAGRLERERVDFEVPRNQTTEVVAGIGLKVTGTDVSRQQFSGWIQILPESRFLWVNAQSIQRPVPFYRLGDGERFDLVATRVSRDFVVGYLLIGGAQSLNVNTSVSQAGSLRSGSSPRTFSGN